MLFYGLFTGLTAGAIGGVLAGIAGVGGGLIYVPLFYALMPTTQQTMALPVMASLIGVCLTGLFSTRAHWHLGHVDVRSCKRLLPMLIPAASIGLWCTLYVPNEVVLAELGLIDAWVAWDYGRSLKLKHLRRLSLWGLPIGYVSGHLGIGGGTMLVPLFRRELSLREAVGTSALCGTVMAGMSVLLNLLITSGWRERIPEHSVFLIGTYSGMIISLPMATRLAARLHQNISERTMRYVLRLFFGGLSASLFLAALTRCYQLG